MTIMIEVAKKFPEVHGLKKTDSPYSAEALREDIIVPVLKDLRPNERLIIVIDDKKDEDAFLYGAAYLIEAFVGLVTYGHMQYNEFIHTVAFDCHHKRNEFYIDRIFKYSLEAEEKRKALKEKSKK